MQLALHICIYTDVGWMGEGNLNANQLNLGSSLTRIIQDIGRNSVLDVSLASRHCQFLSGPRLWILWLA